jgi:hypothetical protein
LLSSLFFFLFQRRSYILYKNFLYIYLRDGFYLNKEQDKRLRSSLLVGIAFLVFFTATPLVLAASPHFIGTPTVVKNPDFALTANFKAAGLGNVVSQAFLSSSGGIAVLQCVNSGGNSPPPLQVLFGPLQGQVVTIQPRNGQITASPTIGPPPLPSPSEICPNPNWIVQLVSLTYSNVVLHIQQQGFDILTFNFGNVDP